jgi:hypothetical protein
VTEPIPIQHFPPRCPAYGDWLARALDAVAAGRCPNHGVTLTASAAWCFACEAAYSIKNGDTVVALYTWLA